MKEYSSEGESGSDENEEGSNDNVSHDGRGSNGSKTDTFGRVGHVECSGRGKTAVTADIAHKATTSAEVSSTGHLVTVLCQWQRSLCSVQDKINGLQSCYEASV